MEERPARRTEPTRFERYAGPMASVVVTFGLAAAILGCDPPDESSSATRSGTADSAAPAPSVASASSAPAATPSADMPTSDCPITGYRLVRLPQGKCALEPLTERIPGRGCSSELSDRPCPATLQRKGFILLQDGVCEATEVDEQGKRHNKTVPCPAELARLYAQLKEKGGAAAAPSATQ